MLRVYMYVVAYIAFTGIYVCIIIYGCLTEMEEEGGCAAACIHVCSSLYCFYWYICVYHHLRLPHGDGRGGRVCCVYTCM